jgi:hypothetical protein
LAGDRLCRSWGGRGGEGTNGLADGGHADRGESGGDE